MSENKLVQRAKELKTRKRYTTQKTKRTDELCSWIFKKEPRLNEVFSYWFLFVHTETKKDTLRGIYVVGDLSYTIDIVFLDNFSNDQINMINHLGDKVEDGTLYFILSKRNEPPRYTGYSLDDVIFEMFQHNEG